LTVLAAAGLTARIAGQEAGPAKSNGKPKVVIQRRDKLTKVDLRKQLLQVPEVDLDQDQERNTSAWLMELAAKSDAEQHLQRTRLLRRERPDLAGLPLRMGADCRLTKKAAGDLASYARELRRYGSDLGHLRAELVGDDSREELVRRVRTALDGG